MIQTRFLNEGTLIQHYSDTGHMLLQVETGIEYADPIDIVPCPYTYEETDKLIENEEEPVNEFENDNDSEFVEGEEEVVNDDIDDGDATEVVE